MKDSHFKNAVAIIGMACRFPGEADNPNEFWEKVLLPGTDAVGLIPEDRWDPNAWYDPDYLRAGKMSVRSGGYIQDIDKFDAEFFSIAPKEAQATDPQQRMLLEATYHAFEDAGIDVHTLRGQKVGVFIGISAHDYGDIGFHPSEHATVTGNTIRGGSLSIASNRISYVFDFRGPSYSIDTACSSSLMALHNAIRSLRLGECSLAVVGGSNCIIKPEITMSFSKGGFLSPDGKCFAFDARANGYIRSEGLGVVILKPLQQSIQDKDRIYSTLIGSAINQDGATDGLSMPSQDAQMEVIKDACKDAGIEPNMIQYVEAHGTGTAAGDSTETASIGQTIGKNKAQGESILIGSVKSNIGHLEPASGMAGLIKLALSMYKGTIPQNVHFETPNPAIKWQEYKLEVPTKTRV